MKRRSFDLNFKRLVVQKGRETGNINAVARQHDLNPNMVHRWSRELNRKDVNQLDGGRKKQSQFVPSAQDYSQLERENEKLKKLLGEQALERDILKDLLKKTNPDSRIK